MACGIALKRSIDLDNLHSPERSAKRRRTTNVGGHCSPYNPPSNSSPSTVDKYPSVFDSVNSKISPEELRSYLKSEVSILRRRKILPSDNSTSKFIKRQNGAGGGYSPSSQGSSSSDSDSEQRMDDGRHQADGGNKKLALEHSGCHQQPMFTLAQVQVICERVLKEQECRLRGEYEQVLNAKLCEQYDSFVRFTYDQIHRRFEETQMSYLS